MITTLKTFDDRWEQVHTEKEWGKYPSEEIVRFVARNFYKRERSTTRILDLGCGSGSIAWFLAREGFVVSALDGSSSAIAKARKRLVSENLTADFFAGDALEAAYPESWFDGIVDSAMICANTSSGIQAILKKCFKILKPGGHMFSTGLFEIGMTGYGTGEQLEDHTFREITEGSLAHIGTVHFFDKDQIVAFWSEAGFANLKIDRLERTDNGGSTTISYLMAEASKPIG